MGLEELQVGFTVGDSSSIGFEADHTRDLVTSEVWEFPEAVLRIGRTENQEDFTWVSDVLNRITGIHVSTNSRAKYDRGRTLTLPLVDKTLKMSPFRSVPKKM